MFVTVTFAPLWDSLPFQTCVTFWPFAKAKVRVQLVMAVVPVFSMVIDVPNPLCHWLVME